MMDNKMTKNKILQIGVGGIGTVCAREIHHLVMTDQIRLEDIDIVVADNDLVEIKNIKYQLFDKRDILKNKAMVIGDRYNFGYRETKIETEKQLSEIKPTIILCCVDNPQARKLAFDYCMKNDCYFIDGRSEGRAVAIFTKHKDLTKEDYYKTLDMNRGPASCQREEDLKAGRIERGNFIVGVIISQLLLNHIRGVGNLPKYIYHF